MDELSPVDTPQATEDSVHCIGDSIERLVGADLPRLRRRMWTAREPLASRLDTVKSRSLVNTMIFVGVRASNVASTNVSCRAENHGMISVRPPNTPLIADTDDAMNGVVTLKSPWCGLEVGGRAEIVDLHRR